MKTVKTLTKRLEHLPFQETWYYGLKSVQCSEIRIIRHKNYEFELATYDIKGNGKKYVKMFDSQKKQVFENLTIILNYTWIAGFTVEFFNECDPRSSCYFGFKAKTNLQIEAVLNRLILIAVKWELFRKDIPSFQYVYAYITFLFFSLKENKIEASKFSEKYNSLRKMKDCFSKELTDNATSRNFSTDTIYYKVLDRFVQKQLEVLKQKPILFNQ